MNPYTQRILPRLIDLAMRHRLAKERRIRLVPGASGVVLEIGIGSGLNLPYYPERVERLFGIDPSSALLRMARRNAMALGRPLELARGSAENLPYDDARFDCVVTTWCLCSIPDPARALTEMRRVLKPGGRLLFVEHGHAPDPGIQAWQRRLNPFWRKLAGGCNLDRRINDLIQGAGFAIEALWTGYLPGPRLLTYTYEGSAVPVGGT